MSVVGAFVVPVLPSTGPAHAAAEVRSTEELCEDSALKMAEGKVQIFSPARGFFTVMIQ